MSNRKEDLTTDESFEDPRSKRITFKFPAQWTFEAMHTLDRQLNDISGRGVKIEGQDRVVNRLKEAIPEEFLQNARLGSELGKEPVISDLRLSHNDLEVIGLSFLSLPTIDRLMRTGVDFESARRFNIARKMCLKHFYVMDIAFENAGGEANLDLDNQAENEFRSQ